MLKHSLLLVLCVSILQFNAQLFPDQKAFLHEHMMEVNKLWSNNPSEAQSKIVSFKSDEERISYHLTEVIRNLKEKNKDHNKRLSLLDSLQDYADAKTFPKNIYHSQRQPYFIDHEGTACAVGHLMRVSGNSELAERIQAEHNYNYLRDIKTVGVLEWAKEYGFALEELAWIQPAYWPANSLTSMGQGVNGSVKSLSNDYYTSRLYLAGDFDSLNGVIPCESGLAYYLNGTYTCIVDKPEGTIQDMGRYVGASRILAGSFTVNNESTPLVIYDYNLDEWSAKSIPGRESAVATHVFCRPGTTGRIRAVLVDEQDPQINELWQMDIVDGLDVWTHVISFSGQVHALEQIFTGLAIGGDFSSIVNHTVGNETIETSNLLVLNIGSINELEIESVESDFLPDDILDIYNEGFIAYIAGKCDTVYPNTFLARYQNNVVQPLLFEEEELNIPNSAEIHAIGRYDDESLILGGEFDVYPGGIGNFGKNLARYDLVQGGYMISLGYLDSTVTHIDNYFNNQYIAGEFRTNLNSYELNHIAKVGISTGVSEQYDSSISVYPNPTSGQMWIKDASRFISIEVYNQSQRLIKQVDPEQEQIDLSGMASGTYYLRMQTSEGIKQEKVVKL